MEAISHAERSTASMLPRALLPLLLAGVSLACNAAAPVSPEEPTGPGGAAAASTSPAPEEAAVPAPSSPSFAVREGGALVRAPEGSALYLADEDHAVVRRIPLPVDEATPPRAFPMPGRPAQVLGVGGRVLVTIRDPGLLLVLRDRGGELVEEGRVALPADAWGVAVTADGERALVSSAWTHRVSLVDLSAMEVRWSVDVAREPRGIAVRADGSAAWVTHLVGSDLTKIERLDADTPAVRRVALPPDPLRQAVDGLDRGGASLGYAAALSADEGRLYVARHAQGGIGWSAWFGSATVDVLGTAADEPVAPRRAGPGYATLRPGFGGGLGLHDRAGSMPDTEAAPFVQPRALVVRRGAGTLLVASEGQDALVELDALAVAPGLSPLRIYVLGGPARRVELFDEGTRWGGTSHGARFPVSACGAPTGVALSPEEETAYVYCRSTDGLAVVPLETHGGGEAPRPYRREETYVVARLAGDPLPEPAARGRRLFYDAQDPVVSGGLACAGCHPDGRDDGLVWREVHSSKSPSFFVGTSASLAAQENDLAGTPGRARQTPMLAGRVDAPGPYGWLAESRDLVSRISEGFTLHRWNPFPSSIYDPTTRKGRAEPIAAFLRTGLVLPPSLGRELTAEEAHGRDIFASETASCAKCHEPREGYTNHLALPLFGRRRARAFEVDPAPRFKVPSLFYVGETAPYFHDGAAATLEDLIDQNLDHMGMTTQLSEAERRDLLAFLRTIEPEPRPRPAPLDPETAWRPARTQALPPDHRGRGPREIRVPEDESLPLAGAEPWPEAPSPEPARGAWAAAPKVRLARSGGACSVRRIREWLRFDCQGNHLAFAGGNRAGLTISASPSFDVTPSIVFPVRRGDRRVVQLGSGWKWMSPFAVLSEQWLDGDPEPTVVIDALYSAGIAVFP